MKPIFREIIVSVSLFIEKEREQLKPQSQIFQKNILSYESEMPVECLLV